MYRVVRKVTRPSTAVEFRNLQHSSISHETQSYWLHTYRGHQREDGIVKCQDISVSYSDNQLEMTTVMLWDNQASFIEYQNDTILNENAFSILDQDQDANGITRELVSQEEI